MSSTRQEKSLSVQPNKLYSEPYPTRKREFFFPMKTKPTARRSDPKSTNAKAGKRPAPAGRNGPPAQAKSQPFPVVGIGASAGGLEAVTALLRALPTRTGTAFVLVQHLDPTHESAMATLLSRATGMPVLEAMNNVALEPEHVYIIPPNKLMEIAERRLKLSPRTDSKETYTPIDHFLKSLANEEGSRAIGVILSGSGGSDGTQGLLAIKAAGGITFAQDEKTAKYPSMPAAAVSAGCVDFVLPPDKIARELARLAGHPYVAPAGEEPERELPVEAKAFEDVLLTLRRLMGVDFSQYKHATLRRRILRRMVLHKFDALKDYAVYLRNHAGEARELFNDILIHVTGFFRDRTVFSMLKRRVFPRLIRNRPTEDPIRLWIPGCSTGEEVYSIAMALLEFLHDHKSHHQAQIFGTDINEAALEKARAGVYPESIHADLAEERVRRFFSKIATGYRINKSVREMCIFARQNVVTDPPFSNLDLVSCRNVLIYLGPTLQRKVMPLFHYSLKPNGYLLLGASETIGGYADLFALADKKTKLYTKKSTRIRPVVSFSHPVLPEPDAEGSGAGITAKPALPGPTLGEIQNQADRILLTHHTPAGVVINRHMEVLQFRGRTGPYLEHPHGEATLNLVRMAREGLMAGLRSAITRAIKQNVRVRAEALPVKQNGGFDEVNLEVVPFQVPPNHERYYLVLFESTALLPPKPGQATPVREKARKKAESLELARAREELAATRESLQAIIEEQEATNEELRSANEEIMSSNEELQSTNEELETAKEELQSTNEELTTLNDELESRNMELEQVNNDLHNLLASVNIPIIMVGGDLRIRRFTAAAEKLLNLIPSDAGRPLTDINLRVEVPDVAKLVGEVIDSLQTRELDVKDRTGHWWSVRVRPYKTTDNKIDGAVLALLDVDLIKNTSEHIRRGRALAEAVVNTTRQPLLVLNDRLEVEQANEAFYRAFQAAPEQTVQHRIYELGGGAWADPQLRTLLEDVLPHNQAVRDYVIEADFPGLGRKRLSLSGSQLVSAEGQLQLILLAVEEIADLPVAK